MSKIYESKVKGIICRSCEDILVSKLNYKRGIIKVKTSYIKALVTIEYDETIIAQDEIEDYLSFIGYPACDKVISSLWYDLITLILIIALFCLLKFAQLPAIPKADNNTSYLGLFLIGLVTASHCIVMCSGIMLSSIKRKIEDKNYRLDTLKKSIIYNISRVLTYSFIGLVCGLAGKYLIFSVKVKSIIYLFTAIYVIYVGLSLWGLPFIRKIEYALPSFCSLKKKYKKNFGPLIGGVFTAFLPCASSNTMFLLAITSGSGVNGFLSLLFWALGTVPLMMLLPIISIFFKKRAGILVRINIIFLVTLGLNMLIMGLKLIM